MSKLTGERLKAVAMKTSTVASWHYYGQHLDWDTIAKELSGEEPKPVDDGRSLLYENLQLRSVANEALGYLENRRVLVECSGKTPCKVHPHLSGPHPHLTNDKIMMRSDLDVNALIAKLREALK